MTGRSIWASVSFESTTNAISDRSVVDTSGVSTSQAVNVDGNRSGRFNLYVGWKINPWDLRVGANTNGGLNRNVNYVNGLLNVTNSSNAGLGINVNKYKDKKYEYSFEAEANFNNSVSSVNKALRTQYWTYSISPNVSFFLPLKFVLHADMNYNIRQKTPVFTTNNNVAILNAYVAKKFGKKELVQLNFSVNDILNQNIGFSRSMQTNTIVQRTYSTIGRYGLLSFIWNFNKLGAGAPKQ